MSLQSNGLFLSRKIQTQVTDVCVCVCVRGGGGRGTRLKTFRIFRDIKERTCANPRSQYHPRGVHEKLAKFPLIVLVSTLEFSPERCVTQF